MTVGCPRRRVRRSSWSGRAGDAVSRYGDFVAGVAEERELEFAYRQAQQIATALDDKPTAERLAAVFRQN